MASARCNGIDIAYEVSGPADGAPLLLIHGLGAQLVRWPKALLAGFADAGFRVIRFDNRDVGLSTHIDAPVPLLAEVTAAKARGEVPDLPYTLSDMAADAAGLLDALGLTDAHVLGVSLGGMIAQVMAIEHSARVRSLTIMMSQSGALDLPGSDPALLGLLSAVAPDPRIDQAGYLDHTIALNRALSGSLYPIDEEAVRAMATQAAARAFAPAGSGRQLAASRAAADRRPALRTITVPTLVIHGADDRLILPVCGEDIAGAITGAWLLIVNGMGHDLPDALAGLFVATVRANAARAALSA